MSKKIVGFIDDDLSFLETVKEWAEGLPAEVKVSSDPLASLDWVQRTEIDTIICDLRMPGVDALSCLERIREMSPDVKLVLLTGFQPSDAESERVKKLDATILSKAGGIPSLATLLQETPDRVRLEVLRKQISQLEAVSGIFSDELISEIRKIGNPSAVLIHSEEGDFSAGQLIEEIGDLSPRGMLHLRLWKRLTMQLRKVETKRPHAPNLMSRFARLFNREWLVLSIDSSDVGEESLTSVLTSDLGGKLGKHSIVKLEINLPHYGSLVDSRLGGVAPQRLLVFGSLTKEMTGFALKERQTGRHLVLPLRWWRSEGDSFEVMVAHVSRGAELLRRPLWSKTFPEWVSFSHDIKAFLGTPRARERWAMVGKKIVKNINGSRTAEELRASIASVYLSAMEDTWRTLNPLDGDVLNLMFFQECYDSLVSSGESRE